MALSTLVLDPLTGRQPNIGFVLPVIQTARECFNMQSTGGWLRLPLTILVAVGDAASLGPPIQLVVYDWITWEDCSDVTDL